MSASLGSFGAMRRAMEANGESLPSPAAAQPDAVWVERKQRKGRGKNGKGKGKRNQSFPDDGNQDGKEESIHDRSEEGRRDQNDRNPSSNRNEEGRNHGKKDMKGRGKKGGTIRLTDVADNDGNSNYAGKQAKAGKKWEIEEDDDVAAEEFWKAEDLLKNERRSPPPASSKTTGRNNAVSNGDPGKIRTSRVNFSTHVPSNGGMAMVKSSTMAKSARMLPPEGLLPSIDAVDNPFDAGMGVPDMDTVMLPSKKFDNNERTATGKGVGNTKRKKPRYEIEEETKPFAESCDKGVDKKASKNSEDEETKLRKNIMESAGWTEDEWNKSKAVEEWEAQFNTKPEEDLGIDYEDMAFDIDSIENMQGDPDWNDAIHGPPTLTCEPPPPGYVPPVTSNPPATSPQTSDVASAKDKRPTTTVSATATNNTGSSGFQKATGRSSSTTAPPPGAKPAASLATGEVAMGSVIKAPSNAAPTITEDGVQLNLEDNLPGLPEPPPSTKWQYRGGSSQSKGGKSDNHASSVGAPPVPVWKGKEGPPPVGAYKGYGPAVHSDPAGYGHPPLVAAAPGYVYGEHGLYIPGGAPLGFGDPAKGHVDPGKGAPKGYGDPAMGFGDPAKAGKDIPKGASQLAAQTIAQQTVAMQQYYMAMQSQMFQAHMAQTLGKGGAPSGAAMPPGLQVGLAKPPFGMMPQQKGMTQPGKGVHSNPLVPFTASGTPISSVTATGATAGAPNSSSNANKPGSSTNGNKAGSSTKTKTWVPPKLTAPVATDAEGNPVDAQGNPVDQEGNPIPIKVTNKSVNTGAANTTTAGCMDFGKDASMAGGKTTNNVKSNNTLGSSTNPINTSYPRGAHHKMKGNTSGRSPTSQDKVPDFKSVQLSGKQLPGQPVDLSKADSNRPLDLSKPSSLMSKAKEFQLSVASCVLGEGPTMTETDWEGKEKPNVLAEMLSRTTSNAQNNINFDLKGNMTRKKTWQMDGSGSDIEKDDEKWKTDEKEKDDESKKDEWKEQDDGDIHVGNETSTAVTVKKTIGLTNSSRMQGVNQSYGHGGRTDSSQGQEGHHGKKGNGKKGKENGGKKGYGSSNKGSKGKEGSINVKQDSINEDLDLPLPPVLNVKKKIDLPDITFGFEASEFENLADEEVEKIWNDNNCENNIGETNGVGTSDVVGTTSTIDEAAKLKKVLIKNIEKETGIKKYSIKDFPGCFLKRNSITGGQIVGPPSGTTSRDSSRAGGVVSSSKSATKEQLSWANEVAYTSWLIDTLPNKENLLKEITAWLETQHQTHLDNDEYEGMDPYNLNGPTGQLQETEVDATTKEEKVMTIKRKDEDTISGPAPKKPKRVYL